MARNKRAIMTQKPLKPTLAYLGETNPDLQSLFVKLKELNTLNQKFQSYLEPVLKDHCQVANLYDHQLIVLVDNASAATQLRFQTPDLLTKMQQDPAFKQIQTIRYKIRPPFQPNVLQNTQETRKISPLSSKSAQLIKETASNIKDEKLKQALERLASHTAPEEKS